MPRKLKATQRAALHRLCLILATAAALPVYLLVPLTGRVPVGAATLAAGLSVYAAVRWICTKAYATFYKGPANSYGRPRPTAAPK